MAPLPTAPSRPPRRRLALLLAGLLAAPAAVAAPPTFHIAPDGSDATGDGSPAAPWGTIHGALDRVPDGSLVLATPGTYVGEQRLRGVFAAGVTVRSAEPWRARLRHTGTVVKAYEAQGITLEGFDIAHAGPGAGALVVHIQDLMAGPDATGRITLRGNVLHDSWNNDLLKINNGARDVRVEGNLFYNQSGSDEHIDVNSVEDVVIEGNVFFNDFEGSGRANPGDTSSFIVVKDSNGADDGIVGARRIAIRRNLFLHWQGSSGSNFVLIGEDGHPYREAEDVVVENNLMVGNGTDTMRAPFGVKGARAVTFRHNTVVGDLPSLAFAFRLNVEGANLPVADVAFRGNLWSDPTGTMDDFSDTPFGETASFVLARNGYWNGGAPLPSNPAGDLVNPEDDAAPVPGDPGLPADAPLPLPRWDPASGRFGGGFASIDAVRAAWAAAFAPPPGSAARGAADPAHAPADDLLGRPRSDGAPDLGAIEAPEPAGAAAALAALAALAGRAQGRKRSGCSSLRGRYSSIT